MAPSRVRGATEVEGTGYVGDSPGGYTCGPTMRARYAGAAARVRVAEKDARLLGEGYAVEAAGSVARERYEILSCDSSCRRTSGAPSSPHPDAWMGGGHVRGAYSSDHVGITAGLSTFTAYDNERSTKPGLYVFPDLELAGGVAGSYRILGGIGTPTLGSLRHPGLYIGGDFCFGDAELQLRAGAHRAGPSSDLGGRLEAIGLFPLAPNLHIRISGAGVSARGYDGGEASLGLRAGF